MTRSFGAGAKRSARLVARFVNRPKLFRTTVVVVATAALTLGIGVTPAIASPALLAQRLAEQTLAEVRGASANLPLAPTTEPEPLPPIGEGVIEPQKESTITAEDPNVEVTFSGHKVENPLDVEIAPLPEQVSNSAESETGGVAIGTPVEITATEQGTDKEVTKFPAEKTISDPVDGPAVATDFTPGVSLEFDVDPKAVKDLEPSSLKIYTRENAGEPWTQVASVYDPETGKIRGELNHLSQMVVIGIAFVAPPGPTIVLDPDNNIGHANVPPPSVSELPLNIALSQMVKARLQQNCLANVVITTEDPAGDVSHQIRADIAASYNPVATVTVAFDSTDPDSAFDSTPDEAGTRVYSRSNPQDQALGNQFLGLMPGYTGRPAKPGTLPDYPTSHFDFVPGAVIQLETLYLNSNFDRPVIDDPAGFNFIAAGVTAALSSYADSVGYNCVDPVTGGLPGKPSQAQLDAWNNLGYQNYLTYGADPVSFSTGNLVEDEPIFELTGPGNQVIDLGLVYNSQDGRDSRVGAGWTFGLGDRAQRYEDGSVLVARNDGATTVFNPDGTGGYIPQTPGRYQTLSNNGGNYLTLTGADGESWVFDAADIDGVGELIRHTDRQGNTTTLTYGPTDWQVSKFAPLQSITDAGGQTVTVGSDALGRTTSFTHPDGRMWQLWYDAAANLTGISNPDGSARTFTYDDAHRMLTATDALGVTYLKNEYDAQGRVAKQWDADGNLRTFEYDTAKGETKYTDNEGNITVFHYDEKSRITGKTDAAGSETHYVFDDKNQVVSYLDEEERHWAYKYDDKGNVIEETLPDGSVITYTYTPTGELASIIDEGAQGGGARTTDFQVDPLGLVIGVTNADGTQVGNTYDGQGNLTATVTPGGATTSYGYDARGNVTSITDAEGAVTTLGYDAANRVTTVTDPLGATTSLGWDSADRLVTETDALGGVTRYTYDNNDHLLTSTDATGAVTSYAWDNLFRLVSVTAPDGGVTKYEYNTEDELTKSTDPLGNVTSFVLDELYRPITVIDPNGGEWTRTYDKVGNLLTSTDPLGGMIRTGFSS